MFKTRRSVWCFWLFALTVCGCSRTYTFTGIIVDGEGKPVGGATIVVYPVDWNRPVVPEKGATSKADGNFTANWGHAVGIKYFSLVVTGDGFMKQVRIVSADQRGIRVVLEKDKGVKRKEKR